MSVDPIRPRDLQESLSFRGRGKWAPRFARSAFSPNIKERRDYSCAVFNAAGDVIAMGDSHARSSGIDAPCRCRQPCVRFLWVLVTWHCSTTRMQAERICPDLNDGDAGPRWKFQKSRYSTSPTARITLTSEGAHAGLHGAFPREIFEEGLRIPAGKNNGKWPHRA